MEVERAEQARALEDAIGALRGVRGARVELTPAGLKTVRVLVMPERSTEETIADIQRLVHDRLGGTVEPARVQVLRAGEGISPTQRRRLTSVLTERTEDRFTARVTLELGGDVLVGETDAPPGPRFEHRSLARATLDGISALLDFPIELQGVYLMNQGDERMAMVVLERGADTLVGSAVVRTDEYDAIARATLDAVNRFVKRPGSTPAGAESAV